MLTPHFLGPDALPSHVAYRLYLALRRGGVDTREAAKRGSVERSWDLAGVYFSAGVARCRQIIGSDLKINTFKDRKVPGYPVIVDATCESATSKLFQSVMTG